MNSAERRSEFAHPLGERRRERRAPPDQHVVVARVQATAGARGGGRQSHDLPQSPAHAVALHGVAYLPRHGEPDPDCPIVGAPMRLQHEGAGGRPHSARRGTKIAPALQPLHGNDGTGLPITH
jgi:hypothetical protein